MIQAQHPTPSRKYPVNAAICVKLTLKMKTKVNVFVANIELNLDINTRVGNNLQTPGSGEREGEERGMYDAATQEAVHKMAKTTSFFHRGQLSGSSGSEVGYSSDPTQRRKSTVGIKTICDASWSCTSVFQNT